MRLPFWFIAVFAIAAQSMSTTEPQKEEPAQEVAKEWKAFKPKAIKKWQGLFGELSGLGTNDQLFDMFYYLSPQPEEAFADMRNCVLDQRLLEQSKFWLGTFLRKEYCPKDAPKKIYLFQKWEISLLFHKWEAAGFSFEAEESGAAVLFRVSGKAVLPEKPVSEKSIRKLLQDIFNLENPLAEKVFLNMKLPKHLKATEIFTNYAAEVPFAFNTYWTASLVLFVTDRDLCLICFKTNTPRQQGLFSPDPFWVNRSLYQADGKTLVSPPPK